MMLKNLERGLFRYLLLIAIAIFGAPCALAWDSYELVQTDAAEGETPMTIPMEWSTGGWHGMIPANSQYHTFVVRASSGEESENYGWIGGNYGLNKGVLTEPVIYRQSETSTLMPFQVGDPAPYNFTLRTTGDTSTGEPRGFDVYQGTAITYFLNYQKVAGEDRSWVNSANLVGQPGSTASVQVELQNGSHFGLKNYANIFYGAQNQNTTVRPGSSYSDYSLNNYHFLWGGADGLVTVTVKFGKYSEPLEISFEGTKLDLDLPEGVPEEGVHMYGYWDNGEPALIGTFADGTFTISNPSAATRTLHYVIYDSGKAYGHPGSDFSQNLAGFDYMNAVDAKAASQGESLGYFVAVIPAVSSLDVCYEDGFVFNTGNNHGEFQYNPKRPGRGVWFKNLTFLYNTVEGMPFYPAGVDGENAFASLDPAKKFYYLRGHSINNNLLSPEWQLMESETPGVYTIDFTYNYHTDTKSCPEAEDKRHLVDVVSYTKEQSEPDFCTSAGVPAPRTNYWYAGMRVRATYNETTGELAISPLRQENGRWKECEVAEASYLPFISLVGAEWNQESEAPIANEDMEGKGTTSLGWQNAWIQYGADTTPIVGRDGVSVYYNTQWPPLHPVYFNSRFTDAAGAEHNLTMSSEQLTFVSGGEIQSGADWQKDPRYNFADVSFIKEATSETEEDVDLSDRQFILYTVDDMWVNGKFKVWSGWNGDHLEVRDATTGLITIDDAEWHSNWNWGYVAENKSTDSNPNSPSNPDYHYGARVIRVGETAPLSNRMGDMIFMEPTYVRSVYFFLDVENPNDRGYSRIYTRNAIGGAQIQASDRVGRYDCGLMQPKMTKLEDLLVTSVNISAFREGDKTQTLIPVYSADGFEKDADEFASMFADRLTEGDGALDPAGFWMDAVAYETPGKYRYTMTVTFSDGSHETVRSNPFYVKGRSQGLHAYQLIEKPDGSFVTYSGSAATTYAVQSLGDTVTVTTTAAPSAEELSGADWLWTDRVLLYVEDNKDAMRKNESWIYNGTPMSVTPDEYAALIVPASSLHDNFSVLYTYTTDTGAGATEFSETLTDDIRLLVPTPRFAEDYDVQVTTDPEVSTFTVGADDHIGDCADEDYPNDVEYTGRMRHISVSVPMEMPNATAGLLALLPTGNATLSFTGSLATQMPEAEFNLRAAEARVAFTEQDIRTWLADLVPAYSERGEWGKYDWRDIYYYTPKANTLTISAVAQGDVSFYKRAGLTANVAFDTPKAVLINSNTIRLCAYRVHTQPNPEVNEWVERICMGPTAVSSPYIGAMVLDSKHRDSSLVQTRCEYDPDRYGSYNEVAAHFSFKSDGEHFGMNGQDNDKSTNRLHHGGTIAKHGFAAILKEASLGSWWSGIDGMHPIENLDLSAAHAYFFNVAEQGAVVYPAEAQLAPARVDTRETGIPEAFIGKHATHSFVAGSYYDDFMTGVENVTASGSCIISGEGFIDLVGTEGGVFGTDGRVLYLGSGRVELPSGIYVVKTAGEALKVIVR